ncbi:MAG TPA: glutathione synthase [Usitatibacter sp.]|nr:glutathione synthase [Usitatibacter sp.]
MRLAFVVDPLDKLKAYKDSSIALMREAARRGHEVHALEAGEMFSREGKIRARTRRLDLREGDHGWYRAHDARESVLAEFDAVLMRKDPPFDQEYFYSTLLLDGVVANGGRVVNSPRALRDWNEKLGILAFPQFAPETLVTSDMTHLHGFIDTHSDCVVKKLDGMGGNMIFRIRGDDPNRNVIVETMTGFGTRTVMGQRYIPDIAKGDKRVLVIDGKPFPQCLARIPKPGETRGNLAAGGKGVAQPISARDREIGEAVGRELVKAGIVFAGLDVIGDYLTEVNVTSPTCIVEIAEQTGANAAVALVDALEGKKS